MARKHNTPFYYTLLSVALLILTVFFIVKYMNYLIQNGNRSSIQQQSYKSVIITIKPRNPLDISSWKTFQDTATSLTFKYPSNWKITEGPKTTHQDYFGYQYVEVSGTEGSIKFYKENQLGGGCDNYQPIVINGFRTQTCYYKSQGTENWSGIYLWPETFTPEPEMGTKSFALMMNARAINPEPTNRNIILQIFQTIKGVKGKM